MSTTPTPPTRPSFPRPGTPAPRLELRGALWLAADGQDLGGPGRIGLLRAVAAHGSITRAAQAFGLSYKAAWDTIHAMNARASEPLVVRTTGGRGGGSSALTAYGQQLLQRFEALEAVHQRFLRMLEENALDLTEEFSLLNVLNLKTSARNQWVATVNAIRAGAVNDEVELLLPGGVRMVAIVTRTSSDALALRLKQSVVLMVKASAVLLATDLQGAKVAADNRLDGVVTHVTPGAVNAEVGIETPGGLAVVAVVTQSSVAALSLQPGQAATALVKASDILLATVG